MVHSGIKHLLKKVNQTNMLGHLDKWNYTVELKKFNQSNMLGRLDKC